MSYTSNPNGARDMAGQYLRQQIEQASPIEQVLMLYDGAIRFLQQAKLAIEAGDIQARCNANRRAMEIVGYLSGLVDPTTGDEAARRLFGIYNGMLKRMLEIDFQNSAATCDDLMEGFRTLRVATAAALGQQQSAKPGGAVVSAPMPDAEVLEKLRRNAVA